jgi:hypothetical protein
VPRIPGERSQEVNLWELKLTSMSMSEKLPQYVFSSFFVVSAVVVQVISWLAPSLDGGGTLHVCGFKE